MIEKEKLIAEIKALISTEKEELVEINPNFLQYFQIEELESIKRQLLNKKNNLRKDSFNYLDEIYEKTKEDSI